MEGHYYDIDDILAEGQVLPVSFQVDAIELGYLDETGESGDDLQKDTKIALPFWLIKPLHFRNMIRVEKPLFFQQRFADALLVDPTVINLRGKCAFWYVLGYKLCKLCDAPDIAEWMEKSLRSRNEEIIDLSHHYKSNNFDQFRSYLCHIEQKLFDQRHDTEVYLHKWKNNIVTKKALLGSKRKRY